MAKIEEIRDAIAVFFSSSVDRDFVKNKLKHVQHDGEQPLLGYLAFFLLGWFGQDEVARENWVEHMLKPSSKGRVDFKVGTTAVEVAVRGRYASGDKIRARQNQDEIAKLLRYGRHEGEGRAVLVLLDYADDPLDEAEVVSEYREYYPLHPRANASYFNVLYFSKTSLNPKIRVLHRG